MLDPATLALLSQFGIGADAAEAAVTGMLVVTAITLATAVPTAMIARRKGRSVALWLVLALSFPAIPLLAVWLLPAARRREGD